MAPYHPADEEAVPLTTLPRLDKDAAWDMEVEEEHERRPELEHTRSSSSSSFEKEEVDPGQGDIRRIHIEKAKPYKQLIFPALLGAVLLQGALLGTGIWLTIFPVLLPSGKYLFRSLTLKSYNVMVTVLGSCIGGAAAMGVTIGARSYASWKLHRDGITVNNYERVLAISSQGFLARFSWGAVLSLLFLLLGGFASGAITGVFSADTDAYQDLRMVLQYPTVLLNPDFYANQTAVAQTVLYQNEDFDGYTNKAARWVRGGLHVNETIASIDNVIHASIGKGVVPALIVVSTWTEMGLNQTYVPTTDKQTNIVQQSTDNSYYFTAPAAQSNASCVNVTLASTFVAEKGFVLVNVTDAVCGSVEQSYLEVNSDLSGTISCFDNGAARMVFFTVNPVQASITPSGACTAHAYVGDAVKLQYSDSTNALTIPDNPELWGASDATSLGLNILTTSWLQYSSSRGSQSLAFFLTGTRKAFVEDPLAELAVYSATLLSIALSKLLATESYYWTYGGFILTSGQNATTANYPTTLRSAAYLVGPSGLNKLWLGLIAMTFLVLNGAIVYFWRHPLAMMDPLNLVDVLVIAQNSPPSIHLQPSVHKTRSMNSGARLMLATNKDAPCFIWDVKH